MAGGGINCNTEQIINWWCNMDVYQVYWWWIQPKNKDLKEFSQDMVWWVTMFIWTIVLIALIYSGILMIFWGADEKQYETGKKWVYYSVIGLLLVWLSYGIIRLIQLLAKG